MNALEVLLNRLDESEWDASNEDEINKAFQQVNSQLEKEGHTHLKRLSEIDRQVFHFTKTPEKRLSYRVSGTQKFEDGTEVPFEWPDIRFFNKEDFEYIANRFAETKNIYAKTEYGLVLYYAQHLQDNAFVAELASALVQLAKYYVNKSKQGGKRNFSLLYFQGTVTNALHIASKRKKHEPIRQLYQQLIEYLFQIHQEWNVEDEMSLRISVDITDYACEYFLDFNAYVDLQKILKKNWIVASEQTLSYVWGAIYVAEASINLSKLLQVDSRVWAVFHATQFENLALEAFQQKNLAAPRFIENAMRIYRSLRDNENLARLESLYTEYRNALELGAIEHALPEDETRRLIEHIKRTVSENDEEYMVKILVLTPMIRPLEVIRKWEEESFRQGGLLNFLPTSIQDKFGNTVAQYIDDEERRKFSLLRTYELHFQVAAQTIIQFVIEAVRADKLSAKGIIEFLGKTWVGEALLRKTAGVESPVSHLELLSPAINLLFEQLEKSKKDPSYVPSFVSATDSLVLKTEYLLREFCSRLQIATFKPRPNNPNIIMEKNLDELLRILEDHLSEDDLYLFRFVLTEKAGLNLRNRIAHGLMDNVEYSLDLPFYALMIILKLSNYRFVAEQ